MELGEKQKFSNPVSSVLEELSDDQDRIIEQPREYILDSVPTAAELQKLSGLSFEVVIRYINKSLVLSTRKKRSTAIPIADGLNAESVEEVIEIESRQRLMSPVNFHSHPDIPGALPNQPSLVDYRSWLDRFILINSCSEARDIPMLIATPEGLITITNNHESQDPAVVFEQNGDVVINKDLDKGLKDLWTLERIKRYQLAKEVITKEDYRSFLSKSINKLKEICADRILTKSIPWDEAQPVIDEHMNPANFAENK